MTDPSPFLEAASVRGSDAWALLSHMLRLRGAILPVMGADMVPETKRICAALMLGDDPELERTVARIQTR